MNNVKINKLTENIILFENLFENVNDILNELSEGSWEYWGRTNTEKIGEMQFFYKKDKKNSYRLIDEATKFCFNYYLKETKMVDWSHHGHEKCNPVWHEYNFDDDSYNIRKWDFPMNGMEPHRDFSLKRDGSLSEESPVLTICGYLNDDYEGGLIKFPDQNISLLPPPGSAIVFQSSELHQVTDLIDKNRLMWTTFLFKKGVDEIN